MKLGYRLVFVWFVAMMGFSLGELESQAQAFRPRVVGYYTSYDIYERESYDPYFVTDIPIYALSHLIYAHIQISDTGQCISSDDWADIRFPYPGDSNFQSLRGNFHQLQLLDARQPELQIMMSIGGWDFSGNFSQAAASPESRRRFVSSCIAFMRRYDFEGIDVDWRYPVSGGLIRGNESDYENYPLLMAEFREQLDEAAARDETRYELSMTVPPMPLLYENFNLGELSLYVDFMNAMTYSYEGSWSDDTAHFAPLYDSPRDPRDEAVRLAQSVNGSVEAYLDAGVAAQQIVIGIPFYGQAWQDVRPNDYFGLFTSNSGVPVNTRDGGLLYYSDITTFLNDSDWVRFFDPESQVPWMYSERRNVALSYEDERSIQAKAQYVLSRQLGGLFAWELSFDDANHTLIDTMASALNVSR